MAENHVAGGQQETNACSQRVFGQHLRAVEHLDALAAGLTAHYFPALAAVGANKSTCFITFYFSYSIIR